MLTTESTQYRHTLATTYANYLEAFTARKSSIVSAWVKSSGDKASVQLLAAESPFKVT